MITEIIEKYISKVDLNNCKSIDLTDKGLVAGDLKNSLQEGFTFNVKSRNN